MASHEDDVSNEIESFVDGVLSEYAHTYGLEEPFGDQLTAHLADKLTEQYGADIVRGRFGERD